MGGIPSGSDPSGYDASALDGSIVGAGLSALAQRTQANITAAKQAEVKGNDTWKTLSDQFFAGLDPDGESFFPLLILKQLCAAFGLDISTVHTMNDAWQAIEDWVLSLPGIKEIVEAITGIVDGTTETLQNFFQNLRDFFDVIDFTSNSFNPTQAVTDFVNLLLLPLNLLLGPNSAINAAQLFGQLQIDLASIFNNGTQLLWNPGFSGAVAVMGNGIWTWDDTVYFTASDDQDPGSAKVTADGLKKALISNAGNVQPGQLITGKVEVLTSGLVSTGTPLQLWVVPDVGSPVLLVQSAAPTGGTSQWTNPPAGSFAKTLLGSWTVAAGVSQVAFRLVVDTTATAGVVHFDQASALLTTSGLPQDWVQNLTQMWNQVADIFNGLVVTPINSTIAALNDWWNGLTGPTAVASQSAQNKAWATRKSQNDQILGDWLHSTYPIGSPTDTAATLVGGKRTYWGAWNDNLKIVGEMLGVIPPTAPLVDIGTKVSGHDTQIQATKDAVVVGIIPSTPSGSTDAAVAAALATLTGSVADQQSQIIDLQSLASGVTSTLKDTGKDNVVTGLGPNWTASGVNYVSRNANYGFIWGARSGNSARLSRGIYNTALSTKTQIGTLVLNALMDYWPADFYGGTYYQDGAPENWIILRADTTNPNNFVFARIRYNDVQIGYCLSGTITMVGSPTMFKASTSAGYKFYAGDASNDYLYKIVSAGATLVSWNDTGHATSSLLANRYAGQAWKSDNDPGRSQEATPAATSWTAFDASGAAAIPAGFGHMSRLSATTVSGVTSGIPPQSFWDNVVALGDGISVPVSGDGGFIVRDAGVYAFSFAINCPSWTGTSIYRPSIAVNNTIVERGQNNLYTGGGTVADFASAMSTAGLLLDPGDLVSGVNISTTMNGDSSGSKSFMKIKRIA